MIDVACRFRNTVMALEELHSTVSKFSFDFFGTETEKKVKFGDTFACLSLSLA